MAAEKGSDLIVMGVQGRGAIDLMVFARTPIASFAARPAPF